MRLEGWLRARRDAWQAAPRRLTRRRDDGVADERGDGVDLIVGQR